MNDNGNKKRGQGMNLPIGKLVPLLERRVGAEHWRRLEASLRALGLVEPLIVCPHGDHYAILDGCLRYRILLAMGVETVPCLVWNEQADFQLEA